MTAASAAPRLRHDLLVRLMLPLLAIVAVTGVAATYYMQRKTDQVYDQWLLDAASSLAAEVRFDGARATLELPPAARAMLSYDIVDQVLFQVQQGGTHVGGDAVLPASGRWLAHYDQGDTYDAATGAQPVRVAAVTVNGPAGAAPVQVRVAETLHKRKRMRSDVLVMLIPLALLLLAAAVTISYAVQRTLRPLGDLAARWSKHSHASLDLIDTSGVPRELLPFASALNELLTRLKSMLDRERQFSANVAHQLRTPLAGLMLGLSRAEESTHEVAARSTIAELKLITQRLNRLVQQLLALGRIGPDGSHTIEFVPTDLVLLVQEVGGGFGELAARHDVALELDVPDTPLVTRVHPDLVIEAVSNLLDNALRHTPRGGTVSVAFGSQPPAIIVSDSGPGIPMEERERMLTRFARGSSGMDQGSGLGLAIVREIARLHGGQVLLRTAPQGGLQVVLQFGGSAA
jgi:two-component system, OmpR family, sensor histidine kinase TctE